MAFSFQYSISSSGEAKDTEFSSPVSVILHTIVQSAKPRQRKGDLETVLATGRHVINSTPPPRPHLYDTMEDEADTKECCEVKLDNYDESSYPANAESESDGEGLCGSEEHLSSALPLEREGILTAEESVALCDDVLCVVCAEILVEPCSLHCGHSFCQLCLASLWKSHGKKLPLYLQCPVCRQPWVHFPGVNIQLRYDGLCNGLTTTTTYIATL